MIYDCFPFFNELDLLEIRLNELNAVVDYFVIAEATHTHNGDPKPLYFDENKARFAKFASKIIHIVVDDFNDAENGKTFQERAWMRENIQRNALAKALSNTSDNDLLIVSDLDEIPSADAVRNAISTYQSGDVVGFALANYCFFLNLRRVSDPIWGNDPKLSDVATFRSARTYSGSKYEVFILPSVNRGATATRFRYVKPSRRIQNAGWHFSYCGGVEAAVKKVKAFNEVGLSSRKNLEEFVQDRLTKGLSLTGSDRHLPEKFDEHFPSFALANRERFASLLAEDSEADSMKTRFLRVCFRIEGASLQKIKATLLHLTPRFVREIIKKLLGQCTP